MYAIGQVWTYNTREGDEGSTLTILHIEQEVATYSGVAWVRLEGLGVRNPRAPGGVQKVLEAPVTFGALDASVIELRGTVEVERRDLQFYAQRRKAIETFDEGAFDNSVADTVRSLQRIHDKHR